MKKTVRIVSRLLMVVAMLLLAPGCMSAAKTGGKAVVKGAKVSARATVEGAKATGRAVKNTAGAVIH